MINVKLTKTFNVSGGSDLDGHTDQVMEELLALESKSVLDADLSVDLDECVVEMSVIGRAKDFDSALQNADSAIRTAIHAAGGSTPRWRQVKFAPKSQTADLVDA